MTSVLIRVRIGEGHMKIEGEIGMATSQGTLNNASSHQKLEETRNGFSPRAF